MLACYSTCTLLPFSAHAVFLGRSVLYSALPYFPIPLSLHNRLWCGAAHWVGRCRGRGQRGLASQARSGAGQGPLVQAAAGVAAPWRWLARRPRCAVWAWGQAT